MLLQAHLLGADATRAPAEQCDEVISNLQKTRSKYVRAQAPYGNVTWARQISLWAVLVRRAPDIFIAIRQSYSR